MARVACIAALLAIVALAGMPRATMAANLQDPKNEGACIDRFNLLISTYYSNDTACGELVTQAMNATVSPAGCPGGVLAAVGTPVHQCMNKNNTNAALTDAWSSFIRNCEVMYVANRGGQGESEEGFRYSDNSCFPRFNSFSDFQSWLADASPYGGQTLTAKESGSSLRVIFSSLAGALVLALLAIWA